MVDGFIPWLNVTFTGDVTGVFALRFAGVDEVTAGGTSTVGGGGCGVSGGDGGSGGGATIAAVTKDDANAGIRALLEASLTELETPSVYDDPGLSGAAGMKVAARVAGSYETVPETAAPVAVSRRVTDEGLIVDDSTVLLNSITADVATDTPVARSAGVTDETLGAISSRTANENPNAAVIAFPALSRTPVVIVTAMPLAFGSIAAATNSAVEVAGR
ncbi:MAG: hypothetical protein ABIZ36_04580 [Gemmatimonadaceae bacterium]